MTDGEGGGWAQEREELLARLAVESSRSAELARRLLERDSARPVPREASARLLAREAERHQAEVALVREAERVAVQRAELLARQLRDLRAEVHTLEAQHATERMQAELELARAKAEAAGLQAAARRRAAMQRPTAAEQQARRDQHEADALLLAQAEGGVATPAQAPAEASVLDQPPTSEHGEPVIVPPEWAAEADGEQASDAIELAAASGAPSDVHDAVRQVGKARRPGFWRR